MTSFHVSAFAAGITLLFLYRFFFGLSIPRAFHESLCRKPDSRTGSGRSHETGLRLSWGIAAILCAVSGVVLSMVNGIDADSLGTAGLKIFPVIVLGGLNSMGGAIVGGIVIGLLETFTGGYVSRALQDLAPYMALILILALKPSGFFGRKESEKV